MITRPSMPRYRNPFLIFISGLILASSLAGCRDWDDRWEASERTEDDEASRPALVVRLSSEAQQEAGIDVVVVSRTSVSRSLETTGWLQAPPATEWTIRAPTAGFFVPDSESQLLAVGQPVVHHQALGQLQAFVSPLDAVQLVLAKEEADTVIGQSTASLEIAEQQLSALTDNEATGAVTGTRLQQLRESIGRSRAAIREAKEKLPFLPAEPFNGTFNLKPIALQTPRNGIVTDVHVTPRQFLAQGDRLYSFANWNSLWLKVPLFEADFHRVQAGKSGRVKIPGQGEAVLASPVTVPAEIPPGTRTISRYYRIDNVAGELRPGQPLHVSLPTGDEAEEVVIPRSAIVWDGFGIPWVYVRSDETTFQRTRVELGQVVGEGFVVRRGLDEGREVVSSGAQALFGEEFRGQIQAEDDD